MERNSPYQAIVIGSSAGGLHALSVLLQDLPGDFSLPIIIVQHRIRDQRDLLEELLQGKCKIPVKQADEKEAVLPGNVYIAPPGYHLLVETDKTFSLSVDKPVNYSRPSIDVLFETAALAYGPALIGIILTGANNDGAAGIGAIREQGGLTIAQDPADAQFSFMPEAAIATKNVMFTWTLKEVHDFLLKQ